MKYILSIILFLFVNLSFAQELIVKYKIVKDTSYTSVDRYVIDFDSSYLILPDSSTVSLSEAIQTLYSLKEKQNPKIELKSNFMNMKTGLSNLLDSLGVK